MICLIVNLKKNERYELSHRIIDLNDNEGNWDHVVVIGKDNNERLFIYDSQTGERFLDKKSCNEYLLFYGCNEYLRIDNLDFNEDVINEVME